MHTDADNRLAGIGLAVEAVILSGLPASGKTSVAKLLSRKLGVGMLGGGELLRKIAIGAGYRPAGAGWWDSDEGMRFLYERENDQRFDREADRRMIERIKRGSVVVTSYTMPWLSDNGLKVWLDASKGVRAARMARRDGISAGLARRIIGERDAMNYELYRNLYGIKLGRDKKPFDVIINTYGMTAGQVARDILKRIKE